MSNPNDPNVPNYGTPEYAEWYRRNVNPQWGEQPKPPKKRHVLRWVLGGVAVFVALIVGISVATAGGGKSNTADTAATTPASTAARSAKPATHLPTTHAPTTHPTQAATTHAVKPAPRTTVAPKPTPAPTHHVVVPKPTATPAPTTHVVVKPKPAPKPALTTSEEQAVESAESYLEMGGFSRAGLIDQLTSSYGEGFSEADAVFAVDHVKVDWNEQAVESAKSYLQLGGFSRASLIDQLTSSYGEQFTLAQATYAADHVGL